MKVVPFFCVFFFLSVVAHGELLEDPAPQDSGDVGFSEPSSGRWVQDRAETRKANTPEDIRALFNTFSEFSGQNPDKYEMAAVHIAEYHWEGETSCPPHDPRLRQETVDTETRLKADAHGGGISASSTGMSQGDPCGG